VGTGRVLVHQQLAALLRCPCSNADFTERNSIMFDFISFSASSGHKYVQLAIRHDFFQHGIKITVSSTNSSPNLHDLWTNATALRQVKSANIAYSCSFFSFYL
jgi:hypothetical protein